jgi:hypothetical protein
VSKSNNEVTPQAPSFENQVLTKLAEILEKLEANSERLDAIDVRLSDLELDTGDGFERDTY